MPYYLTRSSDLPPCPFPSNEPRKLPQSIPHATFLDIKMRLRVTKARYEGLADQHSERIRPTLHARRHAQRLKLALNTAAAVECPQRFVSVDPLPVIDATVNPYSPPVHAASLVIYPEPPRIVAPDISRWAAYVSASSPQDVPVEATSSWFEDIDFMADDEEEDDDDMDSSSSSSSSGSESVPIYAADDTLYYPSSEESYGELLTPESSPLMIRIKRKSILMDDDMDVALAAKQPRYCRKSWVQPIRRV
ncbi:hypothetical protein BDZ89DRAFT_1075255 [Hymenopellis radicata]|nr:hypothetical protein BDZ89DRAFT_1075255 [Hymenopellis radicata]